MGQITIHQPQARVQFKLGGLILCENNDESGTAIFNPTNPVHVRLVIKYARPRRQMNQPALNATAIARKVIRAVHAVHCKLAAIRNRNASSVHLFALFTSFIPKSDFNAIPEPHLIVDDAKVILDDKLSRGDFPSLHGIDHWSQSEGKDFSY
jgi:hypothetical protein